MTDQTVTLVAAPDAERYFTEHSDPRMRSMQPARPVRLRSAQVFFCLLIVGARCAQVVTSLVFVWA